MAGVVDLTACAAAATAGPVLGRAFVDDPLWAWTLRGTGREQRLARLLGGLAGTVARTPGGRVLMTREGTAAALWLPPGRWHAPLHEQVRTAPSSALALRTGVLRGLRLDAAFARGHPDEPHWYLEVLGAVPEARGTGAGRRVVQPVLDVCDRDGVVAYLESSNPRNWTFYERLGFVRGDPIPLPAGCPLVVPMERAPR